jgi:hypothetical protein
MEHGSLAVGAALLLAACGGRSLANEAAIEPAPRAACVTSFSCPEGRRCDDGECVIDRDCPEAREAKLLFEAASGSPWAARDSYRYLTVLDGRDYLVMNEVDEVGAVSGVTRFLELATGREMTLVHEPGHASCFGSPARCVLSSGGVLTLMKIELARDSVSFDDHSRFAWIGYDALFHSDADYRAGQVLLVSGRRVELHQLGRLPAVAAVDLVDKRLQRVLVDEEGKSERIVAFHNGDQATEGNAELAVFPLENGASLQRIYAGLPCKESLVAVPEKEGFFVVRDGVGDEPALSVYRGSEDGGTLLGSLDGGELDLRWAAAIGSDYRSGLRPLETGSSVYVQRCEESGCGSHRFGLDSVTLEEVASVALPEPGLDQYFARSLACGGADIWVVTSAGPDAATRFWSVRIPGNAAFR